MTRRAASACKCSMRPEDGSDDYKYRYIIMPMRI